MGFYATQNQGLCELKRLCFSKSNMRTTCYNHSKLEVNFVKALEDHTPLLESWLDEGERVVETDAMHDAGT